MHTTQLLVNLHQEQKVHQNSSCGRDHTKDVSGLSEWIFVDREWSPGVSRSATRWGCMVAEKKYFFGGWEGDSSHSHTGCVHLVWI